LEETVKNWTVWNVATVCGLIFILIAVLLLTVFSERVSLLSCYILLGAGVIMTCVGAVGSVRRRR